MKKIIRLFLLSALCTSKEAMSMNARLHEEATSTPSTRIEAMGSLTSMMTRSDTLSDKIKTLERRIRTELQQQNAHVTRVLLLGITGSGKTSLVHALAGRTLKVKRGGGCMLLEAERGQELPNLSIGHSAVSQTNVPVFWNDRTVGLSYWDCPGFTDTRGPEQDIMNAFAIDQIFEAPSRVKSLLVIQQSELVDSRGKGAFDRFDKLMRVLPIQEQLYQSVVLVVTKTRDGFSPHEFLRCIEGVSHPLLQFFTEHPERIFSFPSPLPSHDGTTFNLFTERMSVIRSLQENAVSNPQHTVDLDPWSFVYLHDIAKDLGDLKKYLATLAGELRKATKWSRPEDLYQWSAFFNTFLDSENGQIDTPDKLRHQIINIARIPNTVVIQNSLDHVYASWRFRNLLQQIQQRITHAAVLNIPSIPEILRPLLQNIQDEILVRIQLNETIEQEKRRVQDLQHELERQENERASQNQLYQTQLQTIDQKARMEKQRLEREIAKQVENGTLAKAEADKRVEKIRKEIAAEKEMLERKWRSAQKEMESSHRQSLQRIEEQKDALIQRGRTTQSALERVQADLEQIRREQRNSESVWERRLEEAKEQAAKEAKEEIVRQLFMRQQMMPFYGGNVFFY